MLKTLFNIVYSVALLILIKILFFWDFLDGIECFDYYSLPVTMFIFIQINVSMI